MHKTGRGYLLSTYWARALSCALSCSVSWELVLALVLALFARCVLGAVLFFRNPRVGKPLMLLFRVALLRQLELRSHLRNVAIAGRAITWKRLECFVSSSSFVFPWRKQVMLQRLSDTLISGGSTASRKHLSLRWATRLFPHGPSGG